MLKVLIVFMLLVTSIAVAVVRNKAAIVPMGDEDFAVIPIAPDECIDADCRIVGDGVLCVSPGVVRIPINMTVQCAYQDLALHVIGFTEAIGCVVFDIGNSLGYMIGTRLFNTDSPIGPKTAFGVKVWSSPIGDYEIMEGVTDYGTCDTPPLTQYSNFKASGYEWKVRPELSSTATTVTVRSLVFERQ